MIQLLPIFRAILLVSPSEPRQVPASLVLEAALLAPRLGSTLTKDAVLARRLP